MIKRKNQTKTEKINNKRQRERNLSRSNERVANFEKPVLAKHGLQLWTRSPHLCKTRERERERERERVSVWLCVCVKGKYGMCGNEKREGSGKRKKRLYSFLEFDGTLWLGTPPTTFLFLFQFFSCYSFFFFFWKHFYRKWNLNFEFWISFLFKI